MAPQDNPLYDALLKNPEKELLKLEGSFQCNIGRERKFDLHPLHIIRIPERKILREQIYERYGIENIDSYYIPVILDTVSYRLISRNEEPDWIKDMWDFDEKEKSREGILMHRQNCLIGYMSVYFPSAEAIEHEAIHAYFFNNPNYKKYSGKWNVYKIPPEIRGWTEAISYTTTRKREELDAEAIIDSYVGSAVPEEDITRFTDVKVLLNIIRQTAKASFKDIIDGRISRLPLKLAAVPLIFAYQIVNPVSKRNKIAHVIRNV